MLIASIYVATGPSRRVANFLLAWHNAEENGGWDPTDLWNVDTAIAEDMLAVLKLAKDSHRYPGDLGFEPEIEAICGYGGASIHGRR